MDNKKNLSAGEKLIRVAVVMIAVAIVGVCLAIAKVDSFMLKVVIFALSGVLVLISGLTILIVAMNRRGRKKRNYMLYNGRFRKDILPEQLDFHRLRARVTSYISLYRKGRRIYLGDMFGDESLGMPAMKLLLCYELLYELADGGLPACTVFLNNGDGCKRLFTTCLMENGDTEMASRIKQFYAMHATDSTQPAMLLEYMVSQKKVIEQKMLKYAMDNIDSFMI